MQLIYAADVDPPLARPLQSWNGFSAEYVELGSDDPYEFTSSGSNHYLALHDIRLRDGELHIEGLPTLNTRDLRDTMTFVPKGCKVDGWAHPEARPNSFVALYFDPDSIREDLGVRHRSEPPPPFAYARNSQLHSTLAKLAAVVSKPQVDVLLAESVCLIASLEIFGVLADAHGKLSDRQLSAVIDYIEAHLHEEVGLAQLAAVAGLSRFHFSRVFKTTTGQNPHAFVQKRRVDRAAQMLKSSPLPIDAIALAVGYRGAPQFRRAFREVTGVSPQQYRRHRA